MKIGPLGGTGVGVGVGCGRLVGGGTCVGGGVGVGVGVVHDVCVVSVGGGVQPVETWVCGPVGVAHDEWVVPVLPDGAGAPVDA